MAGAGWFSDADPGALEVFLDLQRRMPPGDKIAAVLRMSELLFGLAQDAVRQQRPEADEREILLPAAPRRLGPADHDPRLWLGSGGARTMSGIEQPLLMLIGAFQRLAIPFMICGSPASSVHGVIRATADIDLAAEVDLVHVEPLARELGVEFYVDRDAIREALRTGRGFNLIHYASSFKFDFFP